MQCMIQIPDDLAVSLGLDGENLPRRTLEVLAADGYRREQLTKPDLRRLLCFQTSYEIDGFLKAHNVYDDYTMEDFEAERRALDPLRP